MADRVLVTGGTGFIGSHACVALVQAGFEPVILDNLSNSKRSVLERLKRITGRELAFIEGDLRDGRFLDDVFSRQSIGAVLHFAALKAVGESIHKPLSYYDNNVAGAVQLLLAMRKAAVRTIVFSSSAIVYGDPPSLPIREDCPRKSTNPYGNSKIMVEDMLDDLGRSERGWNVACLRYFNPAGAHESGLIGEDPHGVPNNLMPYITQVAIGRRDCLQIFGDDYPTPDGTGVRDYIHVMDLVDGHVAALRYLLSRGGPLTVNLGLGQGVSVLQIKKIFEDATGMPVPHKIVGRRPGDVAACWADVSLATEKLGWTARRSIAEMCVDAWRWQSLNPEGFDDN